MSLADEPKPLTDEELAEFVPVNEEERCLLATIDTMKEEAESDKRRREELEGRANYWQMTAEEAQEVGHPFNPDWVDWEWEPHKSDSTGNVWEWSGRKPGTRIIVDTPAKVVIVDLSNALAAAESRAERAEGALRRIADRLCEDYYEKMPACLDEYPTNPEQWCAACVAIAVIAPGSPKEREG